MIRNNTFIKNFIWNTIGSTLLAFNSVILLVIITRINGLNDAGIFSITFASASLIYIFAIYSGRNCQITDIENKITDKDYILSRMITCTCSIIILILYAFINNYDIHKNIILILLSVWKILEAFSDVLYGIMQKNDNLYKAGISLCIKSIVGIGLFLVIDILSKDLINSIFSLCIVSLLIIFFYDIPQALKLMDKEKKANIKNIIKIYKSEIFIFMNSLLIMYILNAPKYAIERYINNDIQAIFAIILMPASIMPLFSQFIMAPIINKIKDYYKDMKMTEIKEIDRKITTYIFLFGIFALILGYFLGIPVLNLIYNQNLNSYKINFLIILSSYILYGIAYVKTIILTVFRKLKEMFIIHLICSILMMILSNLLIKYWNINGATLVYIIIMASYYLLLKIILKYQYNKKGNK